MKKLMIRWRPIEDVETRFVSIMEQLKRIFIWLPVDM